MADVMPKKAKLTDLIDRDALNRQQHVIIEAFVKLEKKIKRGLCMVCIKKCNADEPRSFTDAYCIAVRNCEDENVDARARGLTRFARLFRSIDTVKKCIINDCFSEMSRVQQQALNRLTHLLDNHKDTSRLIHQQRGLTTKNQIGWTVVLANHLLSQLSVCPQFIVSDGYQSKPVTCPCGCLKNVRYGDTSMDSMSGFRSFTRTVSVLLQSARMYRIHAVCHKDVWHGSVDIMIGPVAVVAGESEAESDTDEDCSPSESGTFSERSLMQMIAETMVFALVQKSTHPEHAAVPIPTIGISRDLVKIFMYDPENDILFECADLTLFYPYTDLLDITTVTALWLAMNYLHFGTGVAEEHLEIGYTSGFLGLIPSVKKKIYENELHFGNCKRVRSTKPFMPSKHDESFFFMEDESVTKSGIVEVV